MSNLVIPYVFQNQTTADANQVDQNFSAIANVVNGNLDDSNMKPQGLTGASIANEGVTPSNTKGVVYAQDLFAQSFIISGGVATRDGTNLNQVNVTSPIVGWVQQSDGSFRRLSATVTNFKTTIPNTTYYLDLCADGSVNWAQTHSSTLNYATIATVTSDASGNVSVITDTRVLNPQFTNFATANGKTVDLWGPETAHGGYGITVNAVPIPSGLNVTNAGSGSVGSYISANTTYGYQLTSVGWNGVETLASSVPIPIPSGLNVSNASSGAVGSYITANTTYNYQLTSVGWNGVETAPCTAVPVTTGSTAHPINLSWTAVGSQVQYINIYKNGNFLAQISAALTSYQDTGNTATTSQTPPPSNTQATQGVYVTTGSTAYPINLSWNAVSKEAQYINIYKNGKYLTQVPATATSYTDTGNTATTTQTPPTTNQPAYVKAPVIIPSGITGATASVRFVGATTSGAPTTGSFLVGDMVVDQTGQVWICTAAGSPGTWSKGGGSDAAITNFGAFAYSVSGTSSVSVGQGMSFTPKTSRVRILGAISVYYANGTGGVVLQLYHNTTGIRSSGSSPGSDTLDFFTDWGGNYLSSSTAFTTLPLVQIVSGLTPGTTYYFYIGANVLSGGGSATIGYAGTNNLMIESI